MLGKSLKSALIAYWVSSIGVLVAYSLPMLPPKLETYVQNQLHKDQDWSYLPVLSLAILALSIFGSIGLYRRKAWGANIFLASIVIGATVGIFSPPVIFSGIAYLIDSFQSACTGFILALVYFTEVMRE